METRKRYIDPKENKFHKYKSYIKTFCIVVLSPGLIMICENICSTNSIKSYFPCKTCQ